MPEFTEDELEFIGAIMKIILGNIQDGTYDKMLYSIMNKLQNHIGNRNNEALNRYCAVLAEQMDKEA